MLGEGCRTVKFGYFWRYIGRIWSKNEKGSEVVLNGGFCCVKQWFSLGEGREAHIWAIWEVLRTRSISAVSWVAERLNVAALWDK